MLAGHLLNDRYRIKKRIGGGGMANVYLAEDLILQREVAIKALRAEYANDEEFIARFDREAQAATSLSHPNIVNIYDVGEEDHILYMVMEYVDGLTLKQYIQKYSPIDVHEALDIMKQVTSAIAHAHAHDFVHRDIKPQNILIDTYGNVKVTDFGIAVALSATSLTKTNAVLGSVHYLSPEQARGGMATKKSDIYSLGIVLFELLTGRLPFSGQTPVSIALKHLQSETPSIRQFNPDIPQSVENIVLKATTKDPFHRFETVYEMEEAIEFAFHPDRLHEERYEPPVEVGEETKAIPIITDTNLEANQNQDTIIHQPNVATKRYPNQDNRNVDEPPKPKKKKKWWIIATVFFVLLSSIGLAIFLIPGLLKPNEVVIPDVIDLPYEEAVEVLAEANLQDEMEFVFSDEIEADHVVQTDPRVGRTVVEGSTVTLYVSQGKETTTFQNYEGRDFQQVKRLLTDLGFEDILVYEVYSDLPVGQIITQIQPEPDSEVVPSETQVIFEVSVGPETVSLSDLKQMTEQEAKDYLDSRGLEMNKIEEHSNDVDEGRVIRHHPEANTPLEIGSTVDVYISTGPEPLPPVSHYVTFTVPYTLPVDAEEEQAVFIYVEDMNHSMTEVFAEDYITEDTQYTLTLTIAPESTASYKVITNDQVIIERSIAYEEGE